MDRTPSPEHTAPIVVDVHSDSPALLRGASSRDVRAVVVAHDSESDALDEDDEEEDEDESSDTAPATLSELELSEYEYRRGHQAVPMQSPGDELEIDMESTSGDRRQGRRRRRLPSLRRRQFFDGPPDAAFERSSGRSGRMMQRITLRRRKAGDQDVFWTGIFISNLLSLAVMSMLMFYLLQTDFFESHQTDLFGTTVDNRFTVVSPENADAKIYMKSGYSTSRYSEAMIAFGNGELKIGRRALSPTDLQGFYGMEIASNGSTTFTNKLHAPFVKTDYVHAAKAVVFDDGTVMTTAANLSGGINEVGDLNLISKSGSVTLSAGGKPVIKVDPDAIVNLLDSSAEDPEMAGIAFNAAGGDISVADTFKIHHDVNSTTVSSTNPIELNSSQIMIGSTKVSRAVITVSSPRNGTNATKSTVDKKMTLEILGQSSVNQSYGGDVVISGGNGTGRGGDVVLAGGKSAENENGDVEHGSVLINAKLDRTTTSMTEIGSHSNSHKVNLHGAVAINNGTEKGHPTSLYVGGGRLTAVSKNITIDNQATNGSAVAVKSHFIDLKASEVARLSINENLTYLSGSRDLLIDIDPSPNSTHSASVSMNSTGHITMTATGGISLNATARNSTIDILGEVRIGNGFPNGAADVTINDGVVAIDADSLVVGGFGNTDTIVLASDDITIGNSTQKSDISVVGENASILCPNINVGSSVSQVMVTGKEVSLRSVSSGQNKSKSATIAMRGESISLIGSTVAIGGKNSKSVKVGDLSTDHVSIVSTSVEFGVSAKSVTIGDKAGVVSIGSEKSAINIKGKVTINGKPFEERRYLQASDTTFFAVAGSDDVEFQLPDTSDEVRVPIQLISNSEAAPFDATDGHIQVSKHSSESSGIHMLVGLSLQSVKLRLHSHLTQSSRSPKLRCRIYNVQEQSNVVLEVVSQLEACEDEADCRSGFFHGASSQRIVELQRGDRLSLMCAASATGARSFGTRTVHVDNVQLYISSV